jgi:hypothetical protein
VDELNSLVSHVHDQIGKVIENPQIVWSSAGFSYGLDNDVTDASTRDRTQDQQSLPVFTGPPGGSVSSLAGTLDLAGTMVWANQLLNEIKDDKPEITFYQDLRAMSQLTGPAASRIIGDVESRVLKAQAIYDQTSMSLFRMAVAIGGMRANDGSWGTLNRHQQKFAPFNLDSYENGDLDMQIMPRPLLIPTKLEIAQEGQAQWTGVGLAVTAGAPLEYVLREQGYTDAQLAQLASDKIEFAPPAPVVVQPMHAEPPSNVKPMLQ